MRQSRTCLTGSSGGTLWDYAHENPGRVTTLPRLYLCFTHFRFLAGQVRLVDLFNPASPGHDRGIPRWGSRRWSARSGDAAGARGIGLGAEFDETLNSLVVVRHIRSFRCLSRGRNSSSGSRSLAHDFWAAGRGQSGCNRASAGRCRRMQRATWSNLLHHARHWKKELTGFGANASREQPMRESSGGVARKGRRAACATQQGETGGQGLK